MLGPELLPAPVSYTHLDVYKRQVRCCASSDLYREAGLFLGCGQAGARVRASGVVIPFVLVFVMPASGYGGGGEATSGSEEGVGGSAEVEG